jgi:transcriptional regulator with XRE-family HTH domain
LILRKVDGIIDGAFSLWKPMAQSDDPSQSDDPVSQRLLDLLRQRRRELGMSIYDLAAKVGKTPSFISLIENGKQVPDLETIERIAKSLGLDQRMLKAWVEVRRSRDATATIRAAHELTDLLGMSEAATLPAPSSPPPPQLASSTPAQMRALSAPLSARLEAPHGLFDRVKGAFARSPAPAAAMPASSEEEIRAHQMKVPVVAEGTEPGHPDEQRAHPRRPLWLDLRLLPPRDKLRQPFAFRVGRENARRMRGQLQRGDYVVITRGEWTAEPESFVRDEIYAVRVEGRVVLSQVAWSDGRLVLLPPSGRGEFRFLEAKNFGELGRLLAGKVVTVVRVARGREEATGKTK